MESQLPPDEDFYKESKYLTGKIGIRPLNNGGLDNYVSKESFNYNFLHKMNNQLLDEYHKEHNKQKGENTRPQDPVNINQNEIQQQNEIPTQNESTKDKKQINKQKGSIGKKKKWQPNQGCMLRKMSPRGKDKKEIEEMDKPQKKEVHKLEKFFKDEQPHVNRTPKIVTIHD